MTCAYRWQAINNVGSRSTSATYSLTRQHIARKTASIKQCAPRHLDNEHHRAKRAVAGIALNDRISLYSARCLRSAP